MKICFGPSCFLLLLISFIPVSLAARGRYAQKLFKDLFVNYSSALRPVDDTDHVINVTLQVTLGQVIDMDEKKHILTLYLWVRQTWTDSFLTWSKDGYDGLGSIRIPSSYVWKPDIVLYNSAEEEFSTPMETNVVLRSDGQVTWDRPTVTKSSCSVDMAFFPFDLQRCELSFGSWSYNGNQIDLNLESTEVDDHVPNVEWEVLAMPAQKRTVKYGCCSEPYADVRFTLELKRRASFYIFNLLLPCILVSLLAPLGFYLPAYSGEKVSLGVTVLLALTVFQLLAAQSIPPSESMTLIGKYYIATMAMVTASTALSIFVINLHHRGHEARPVPKWLRVLVLKHLNRLCRVYQPREEVSRKPAVQSCEVNGDPHEDTRHRDQLTVNVRSDEDKESKSSENRADDLGLQGDGLRGNVAWIAASLREQRATQALSAEWRRVAGVVDRALLWVFFIMVFVMSALILGRAI